MPSSIDMLRAGLGQALQQISANVPENFKLTLVARHIGVLNNADIVHTEDDALKAADVLKAHHDAAFKAAIAERLAAGDKAYLHELAQEARRLLPDGYAFAILVCPFGTGDRRFRHVTSSDRESLIAWLKEYAAVLEVNPEAFDGHL